MGNGDARPTAPKLRNVAVAVIGLGLTLAVLLVGGVLGIANARHLSILVPSLIGVGLMIVIFVFIRHAFARREHATEKFAEQAERLRTTLASIGDAVITTDTAGRITNLNAVGRRPG